MSTPNNVTNYISNELEDFQAGGLYPGGTGIAQSIRYVLWDYEGKQPPDSAVAVHMDFKPIDGGNDGKNVSIFWSVGPASDFVPSQNGGHLIPVAGRPTQGTGSNWAFVLSKFRDNCGLARGVLSGPEGITILSGAELTIAKVPQPKREGLTGDDEEKEKGGRKFPKETYIPTRVIYPWDRKGGPSRPAVAVMPSPAVAPATTPASTPPILVGAAAQQAQTSAPSTNGNAILAAPTDLASALAIALKENGGSLTMESLAKAVLGAAVNSDRGVKVAIAKQSKDPALIEAAANANGWIWDGKDLIAV